MFLYRSYYLAQNENISIKFYLFYLSETWLKIRLILKAGVSSPQQYKQTVSIMLIFWEQRLVFLATPKAGSTSIEAALEPLASVNMKRPGALKHMTARNYQNYMAPYLRNATGDEFTTVALMREPEDWLASWYRFALQDDDMAEGQQPQGFDAFIKDYIAAPTEKGIGNQSDILCDDHGNKAVDHIFRYEKMNDFVTFLEDRLNCMITLPHINVPPKTNTALPPGTAAELRSVMKADYALYDQLGA